MKQVIFNGNAGWTKKYDIQDFRNAIVAFLIKNGMSVTEHAERVRLCNQVKIEFPFSCANNDFTRSFALLQLVCSTKGAPLYFEYRDGRVMLNMYSGIDYLGAINYINENSNIEVIE
jgi:hypothetical protein